MAVSFWAIGALVGLLMHVIGAGMSLFNREDEGKLAWSIILAVCGFLIMAISSYFTTNDDPEKVLQGAGAPIMYVSIIEAAIAVLYGSVATFLI